MLLVSIDSCHIKLPVKVSVAVRNVAYLMIHVSKSVDWCDTKLPVKVSVEYTTRFPDIKLPIKIFLVAKNITDFVDPVSVLLHFVSVLLDDGQ